MAVQAAPFRGKTLRKARWRSPSEWRTRLHFEPEGQLPSTDNLEAVVFGTGRTKASRRRARSYKLNLTLTARYFTSA